MFANPAGSAWSFGGSILTFAFPMILFIVVAVALYVLYTKPEFVPGHRRDEWERPVSYTAVPGKPAQQDQARATPATTATAAPAEAASPAGAGMAGPALAGTTEITADEPAGTGATE